MASTIYDPSTKTFRPADVLATVAMSGHDGTVTAMITSDGVVPADPPLPFSTAWFFPPIGYLVWQRLAAAAGLTALPGWIRVNGQPVQYGVWFIDIDERQARVLADRVGQPDLLRWDGFGVAVVATGKSYIGVPSHSFAA